MIKPMSFQEVTAGFTKVDRLIAYVNGHLAAGERFVEISRNNIPKIYVIFDSEEAMELMAAFRSLGWDINVIAPKKWSYVLQFLDPTDL